jgi:hypothetical protein
VTLTLVRKELITLLHAQPKVAEVFPELKHEMQESVQVLKLASEKIR